MAIEVKEDRRRIISNTFKDNRKTFAAHIEVWDGSHSVKVRVANPQSGGGVTIIELKDDEFAMLLDAMNRAAQEFCL